MNGRRGNRPVAFSHDAFPDRPRILFIGLPSSTHTHSWIDLLEGSSFDVRLFGLPEGCPPSGWKVETYLTTTHLPEGLDPETRLTLYPTPEEVRARQRGLRYFVQRAARKGALVTERLVGGLSPVHAGLVPLRANSAEEWLAQLIREWEPDIVHTLGLDPAGFFYHRVCEEFALRGKGRWVLQLRGGSDLTLSRFDPEAVVRMAPVLRACDQLVSDNLANLEYARRMGVREDQFAPIVPVPGTGGIDVDALAQAWQAPPSERRLILWPKAYDCPWSLALPVFEAIKLAWDQIQPCEIWMLAMNREARMWYGSLPEEIRVHCHISERLPRDQVLKLMAAARVMLAPSLVDGTPNTMFEAMASGALPILSPLDTIVPLVCNEENVLFARNLYPWEIVEALIRSMTDDSLVDSAAARNSTLVRKLADRAAIRPRVVKFYNEVAGRDVARGGRNIGMSEREKASCPLVSIITPAYNRADYLAETIDSVLGQDYPFIEYIVLDDGSTDNTREVLSRYDGRIVWETHPNMGEARTVNRALEMSRGDIIVVVNSDDPLRPGAISRAVAEFASWQDLLAVYGDWVEIDPNSVDIRRVHVPQFDLATMMLSSNISLGPGTFFRRCVLAVVGMRDTSFRYVGDLDYWFRVAAHGPLRHVPEVLATHRTHPSAISFAERGRLMAAELVAVVQKVFADPELPTGIRRMRRAAVGNAHLSAAMACGGDDRARIEHLCRAFVYAPALTLRRVAALVAAWLYRHAPRPIAGILRRVWHARRKRHMLRSREGESPRRQ